VGDPLKIELVIKVGDKELTTQTLDIKALEKDVSNLSLISILRHSLIKAAANAPVVDFDLLRSGIVKTKA
jgi:hypothetical protein